MKRLGINSISMLGEKYDLDDYIGIPYENPAFLKKVEGITGNLCAQKIEAEPDERKREDLRKSGLGHWSETNVKKAVVLSLHVGIEDFSPDDSVYVVDIACMDGTAGAIFSSIYGGEYALTVDFVDRVDYGRSVSINVDTFGLDDLCETEFVKSDAWDFMFSERYKEMFENHDRRIWICRYPDLFTNTIFEMVANLREEDMPDRIVIMPCGCHSYLRGEYMPSFVRRVDSVDWNTFSFYSKLGADALRVSDLVMRNPYLEGMVFDFGVIDSNVVKISRKVS